LCCDNHEEREESGEGEGKSSGPDHDLSLGQHDGAGRLETAGLTSVELFDELDAAMKKPCLGEAGFSFSSPSDARPKTRVVAHTPKLVSIGL
jgi:hypothetical protein